MPLLKNIQIKLISLILQCLDPLFHLMRVIYRTDYQMSILALLSTFVSAVSLAISETGMRRQT